MHIGQQVFSHPARTVATESDNLNSDGTASNRASTAVVPAVSQTCLLPQGFPAGESNTASLRLGQVFADKYTVQAPLGEGVTGTVWHARHRNLHCDRAIKIIASNLTCSPEGLARMGDEGTAMTRLNNPHVVTVHDFSFANGLPYIELALISGQSLDRLLKSGAHLPLDTVVRIVTQLCEVLQVAHGHQISHHALKPANLMLLDDRPAGHEHLMVLDFGVSKLLDDDTQMLTRMCLTRRSEALGAPGYLSPEQILNQDVDHRVDIYATGVILYELLTGHLPFKGSPWTVLRQHVHTPPPFPTPHKGSPIPPELGRIALWCLAKNPSNRPASARDLADALLSINFKQVESAPSCRVPFPRAV